MVLPIVPMIAAKAAGGATSAIKNDIAVIRWVHPGKKKGKGKKAIKTPDKEIELHVNPMSIGVGLTAAAVGVGAAALVGAVAIFASGNRIERTDHVTQGRIMTWTQTDDLRPNVPLRNRRKISAVVVRTARNRPLFTFTPKELPDKNDIIREKERQQGWHLLESSEKITKEDGGNGIIKSHHTITAVIDNHNKRGFKIDQRKGVFEEMFGGGLM